MDDAEWKSSDSQGSVLHQGVLEKADAEEWHTDRGGKGLGVGRRDEGLGKPFRAMAVFCLGGGGGYTTVCICHNPQD